MSHKNLKKNAVKALRKAKKLERKLEKRARRALKEPSKPTPPKPYVHPWTLQDIGSPTVVDQLQKEHCCGCGSCLNACPKNAISMVEDKEGFLYPAVDKSLCIDCGICVKKCPVCVEQPKNEVVETCYATIADDDDMRMKSSSGGLFTQIARYAFERGGVVYGAAYGDDHVVSHRYVENEDDLDALRRSKYVQSSTGTTYLQVKQQLQDGRYVLYSGCPCQIAGLYAFLGKDYDNLLTVDLICHGTPSPGLFRRYLDEDYEGKEIAEVNFRDKAAYGWSTHMNVYFKDGDVARELCSVDPYYRMFLPCLAMRPFCSVCKFTKIPRVADLSIGDWWGIGKFDETLNDTRGTSLLLVNNDKGRKVLEAIKADMRRCEEYPLDKARPRNYTIDKPFRAHPARARFFELLEMQSFDKSVRSALDYHYDVGIFGLWYGENYGSMLTYFGLKTVVESMGLSTVMIENPLMRNKDRGYSLEPHRFARRQGYYMTKLRPLGEMKELNAVCDTFLLGSDQLWNPGLSRPYRYAYFLDFASKENKRIAYGTSFGKDTHELEDRYVERSAVELKKFDAISVRDNFSKDILNTKYYGIQADKVLDPALLCPRTEYRKLADQAGVLRLVGGGDGFDTEHEDYVFAYILDPSEQTMPALEKIAATMGKRLLLAIDYAPRARQRRLEMLGGQNDNVNILDVPSCEDWLKAIKNSSAVLTDSFHGTIFAHVFERDFVAIPNYKRGAKRFTDLLDMLGLSKRALESYIGNEDAVCDLMSTPVDYEASLRLLEVEVEKSLAWLEDALTKDKVIGTQRAYIRKEHLEKL